MKQSLIMLFATGFGLGKLPWAPGTWASVLGIGFYFLIAPLSLSSQVLILFGFILFSIWIASQAEKFLGQKDASVIVIDEIAGMGCALIGSSLSMTSIIIGFILFRFFDILKPFPISWVEKKLTGGMGVVMDDVVAG
ncbi:MAG: phosphatidylglycerophosphatase A, partial [Deltaproteobacteria bacterium]|nr:phosphatidylglycerophosphatase A [Deltaproteobacteria bacterium]